ncbi:hypothetical protein, partial [Methylibium sp.]|uniref:hypothetical protein n=1 Tax=Methylibium sp. TaxID=2067992 RepID=UPI00286B3180
MAALPACRAHPGSHRAHLEPIAADVHPRPGAACFRLVLPAPRTGQRIDRAVFATLVDTRVLDRGGRGVRGPLERI